MCSLVQRNSTAALKNKKPIHTHIHSYTHTCTHTRAPHLRDSLRPCCPTFSISLHRCRWCSEPVGRGAEGAGTRTSEKVDLTNYITAMKSTRHYSQRALSPSLQQTVPSTSLSPLPCSVSIPFTATINALSICCTAFQVGKPSGRSVVATSKWLSKTTAQLAINNCYIASCSC